MSHTALLAAILGEVGASDYLQAFVNDDQDDDCIGSYRKSDKVSRDYGLPPQLASTFVSMCRAALIVQKFKKSSGSSGAKSAMLAAILDEVGASDYLQAFVNDDQDDDCVGSYKKSDKVSRDYGLPPQLASTFVSMCRSIVSMQHIIATIGTSATPPSAVSRCTEVVVSRPQQLTSLADSERDRPLVHTPPQSHPQQPFFSFGASANQTRSHEPQAAQGDEANSPTMGARISAAAGTIAKLFKTRIAEIRSRKSQFNSRSSESFHSGTRATETAASRHQFAPGISDLQVAVTSLVGALPPSHSQYSVEMSILDFAILTQQLITTPPHDQITVACCHRLTPRIRTHIRLGSKFSSIALLNPKSAVVQEWTDCPNLAVLKSIPNDFANIHSVRIVFVSRIIPIQAPFILPDAFSEVCMRPDCMAVLPRFERDFCRCCGLLFCSSCCNKEMPLPKYSMKKAHRVCDNCHNLFACAPDSHWAPSWVLQKRRDAFIAATEQFTNALDLIEKRPHALLLGLNSERLWKSDDPEFKQAKLQLNKSHPDAVAFAGGDASQSSANFSDIKDSCALLVEWLSVKEMHFHESIISSSPLALFDESCKFCNRKFAIISIECKKHYCRICGHSICGRPSCFKKDGKILPTSFGYGSSPVSVCVQCDQQYPVSLHPLVLSQEGYVDYFARIVAEQQEDLKQNASKRSSQGYLAPLYMSRLHVVATVEVVDPQTCRVHILFSSSIALEQSEIVTQDLGRLRCTVMRPLASFEVLRKCLLGQGYPKEIVPELNTKIPRGPGMFLNAVLQHRRLRHSPLIPLFCASTDSWDELQRVLTRVSTGTYTDASPFVEVSVKSLPATLPCSAVLELFNVLSCSGMTSVWGPLVIKFFSIASLLTEAIDTAQHYEDRLSSFQGRSRRYMERTLQAQRFAVFFNEKQLALKDLLQKSLDRLSRERLRLANQRSSIYPIFTRRQQDLEERKCDWDWYRICQEQFNAENERFEADAVGSKTDFASCEKLITDCIKALDNANKVQSSHHDWMFEALSSLKLGRTLPAIIPAITNLEEQLSTVSKKTRDDLAQERSELDQQRVLLMQEVHLNTLESSGGQFSFIKSFHSILDQFQTCVKCEEADINSEIACRNEKIARIEADILRVEQAISKSETALQQRVTQRNELNAKISMTLVNVKHASEQCRSTVPLLQSAVSEAKAADESVRERTQQQLVTTIVLKKLRDSMQPARAAISQRCEQAAQFISLQTNLVRDVATVVMQSRQLLEAQMAEVWALPLDFSYQATALEKGSIDHEDLQMIPFREKRAQFTKRVLELTAAHTSGDREQCEQLQKNSEELNSALNALQHSDIKAVSGELAVLNAAMASWTAVFEEELKVHDAAKQAAITRVNKLFDCLNELQLQSNNIYGEQTAWIEDIQKKCTHSEFVIRGVTLHLDLEIRIRTAAKNIADLRRQVDDLITSPVTSPRTVQQNWVIQSREMQADVEKFEKNFQQERQVIEKNVQAALAQTEHMKQELSTQRLERLEVLGASTLEVSSSVAALQQESRQSLAKIPSSSAVDEEFLMWFTDRCSQASTGQVPLVQSCISRALSIIVDGSEQPFLAGISRAREELAMSLPRIAKLHAKLLCHNEVRRSYYDVASAVLENLALNRDVYTGVDYTSLTHATQELLGQASTSNSLPVPYKPDPQVATQVPPVDQ